MCLEATPREVRIVEDARGKKPYSEWLSGIDPRTRGQVRVRMSKAANGNLGDVKSVGGGVFEFRFQDGCRVYFTQTPTQIFLLGGGSKNQQQRDIDIAMRLWREHDN